ncbi:MAG: NAD(P)(+) transhydrogenase (Re/Si-specific) subunit beta, partial [Lachnospiraceae bacterium]|nr:NAD(P)(+) transhydrogenase (Re/Si-specific) subunit beta [Lachnospiraceae bacterium]
MNPVSIVIYTLLSILVLVGLSLQSKVRSAAAGNFLAMGAMIAAIIYIIIEYSGAGKAVVWIGLCIGLIIGLVWAFKVKMVQMPQTVGL